MRKKFKYKIAVVTDPLFKLGGAERHARSILQTFDNVTIYTPYCDKKFVKEFFPNIKVKTSFMQYMPFKFSLRYLYLLILPLAYKSFRFKGYDAVVSISIGFAKFTKGRGIPHIHWCLSPSKFFWEKDGRSLKGANQLKGINRLLFKFYSFFIGSFLEDLWKKWDRDAIRQVDRIIANSKVVQKRIEKYYGCTSDVIYPPVEVKEISEVSMSKKKENWFLYLGRIETYKGVDLAIKGAFDAKVPLKIAGVGDDLERMKELVKKLNAKGYVKFVGYPTDDERIDLLCRAKALIFPVKGEDFGIVPVEANAAGTPVIAYRDGGVLETISEENPKTGIFFDKYSYKEISKILSNFDSRSFKADNCRKQANNFTLEIFQYKLRTYVEDVIQNR